MSKNIFVAGTGTDVGKTYVTALMIKKLRDAGLSAGYYKAAASGNLRTEDGLVPGDADFVDRIAGMNGNLTEMIPYVYENAVSPHLASRMEGNPVELSVVKAGFEKMCAQYDYVTMEGSGGIICPIRFDNRELWLEDVIRELNLNIIIVAEAGLGTINNSVLTYQYIRHKGLKTKGFIFNHFHSGNGMEEDNRKMVEHLTGLPVITCVQEGDTSLDMDVCDLVSLYE